MQDMDKVREVFRQCLNVIPHKEFSFSKVWILYAEFEVRQMNLVGARNVFGNAIGARSLHLACV